MLKNQTKDEVEQSLQEFQEKLNEVNQTRKIKIDIAYGYALKENKTLSNQELFKKADEAMYCHKQNMKRDTI